MLTGTPFDRHERAAVGFSGGKDSLAVTYLLREFWPRITFYHVDAGGLLPEVREIVKQVEDMVPNFCRIETNAAAWSEVAGLPSDLVPTSSTQAGMAMGMSQQRIVDRMDCCAANLILPMHQRMLEDKVTLAIRGTKRADLRRLPAVSGDTTCGYELWLPLQDWSHEEVFEYLRSVDAPICRVYENAVNAPECATCSAWSNENRGRYLKKYHPTLFAEYSRKLRLVADEIAPVLQTFQSELEVVNGA
jgi:phosphoadenosine phosphosulfate reductase